MKILKSSFILAAVLSVLMLTSCSNYNENKSENESECRVQNSEIVSFDEVLMTRRSVRSYDASKTITEEEVRELLISTQEAPSWANQQPSKYYVAMSPEKIEAVANLVGERNKQGFFQGEPANEVGDGWGAYDNGLSNAYFILKARAKGFDTLIMGMRDSDALRTLFNIPENEAIMAVISLGYRADEPKQPKHRPLEEIALFF